MKILNVMLYWAILASSLSTSAANEKNNVFFYLKDHLGNTRVVLNRRLGNIVETSSYYPFGKEMPNLSEAILGSITPEKFVGKELDAESDLYYFGARYYDSELGLFLSIDPAREGNMPYLYVGGNPILYNDPTGLERDISIDEYNYRYANNLKDLDGWEFYIPSEEVQRWKEIEEYNSRIKDDSKKLTYEVPQYLLIAREYAYYQHSQGKQIPTSQDLELPGFYIDGFTEDRLKSKISEWGSREYRQFLRNDCSGFVYDVWSGNKRDGWSGDIINDFSKTKYDVNKYLIVYYSHTRTYKDGSTDGPHVGIIHGGEIVHFQDYDKQPLSREPFKRLNNRYQNRGGAKPVFLEKP